VGNQYHSTPLHAHNIEDYCGDDVVGDVVLGGVVTAVQWVAERPWSEGKRYFLFW
jgi:hypothetical protein